ncbi:MAG: polyphosphate kinase 2 [Candidatus Latescibacteria bacterium]|nr:polyphosphate kinase 2 [Candidatus Latescibacterota bacterium]
MAAEGKGTVEVADGKKTVRTANEKRLATGGDGKGVAAVADAKAPPAIPKAETPQTQPSVTKHRISEPEVQLSEDDLRLINTRSGLTQLLLSRNVKLKRVRQTLRYQEELMQLQVELIKLQRWVQENARKVAILFEGRDAAGKGGTIRRFTEHLSPRSIRVVALPKPTEEERGQWYFQRYSQQLPNAGEIVFFDRSWYNRAVVEPVNGFCTKEDYARFIQQVPEYEHMLYEDGLTIVKFWFSISKEEQLRRFESRRGNPLKQWKLSPVDARSQELWDLYTSHKEQMFSKTHTSFSPWIIVRANDKQLARLESILPYSGKEETKVRIIPDPNIVTRFHREIVKID